jgi:hypothetical protein
MNTTVVIIDKYTVHVVYIFEGTFIVNNTIGMPPMKI